MLARAFLIKNDIILFDEVTSLQMMNPKKINEVIVKKMQQKKNYNNNNST